MTAFLFDLDGVITRTEEIHYNAWNSLIEYINANYLLDIKFSRDIYREAFDGKPRSQALKQFLINTGMSDKVIKNDIQKLLNKKDNDFRKLLTVYPVEKLVYSDSLRFLDIVAKKKNSYTVLVSSSRNAYNVLKKIGLESYFRFVIDGNLLRENPAVRGKPSPDMFNYAINKCTGLIKGGENIVVFEDSIAGVEAGIRSNATHVYWIQRENFGSTIESRLEKLADGKNLKRIGNFDSINRSMI